jgi:hypothetical protein
MRRLLAANLCAFALLAFGIGNAKAAEGYALASQDKTEVKNYDIYVGQYEVRPGFVLTITIENNKLMGQPTGDAKIEFKADAEADMFSSAQENVQLKFVRDENGVVNSVIVTLDGNPYPSKKIK